MTDTRHLVKLSKFLALILRHQPERFGLELDEQGWVALPEVLEIVSGLPNFRWATQGDVMRVVDEGCGDGRKRFEVVDGRIRARYGHSVEQPIAYEPVVPPDVLYHAAAPIRIESISREGLLPMERQYVHLSVDSRSAIKVGEGYVDYPVVISVRAAEAYRAGVFFYRADETVYLAKGIPAQFLDF